MYKVLPVTHSFITTTPFVMPNSYIYNEEKGFDGESMNDWFSGSGSVLVKLLIGGVFGIRPTLDNLEIRPSAYMPCAGAEISIPVKGATVRVVYKKEGNGGRKYRINGAEQTTAEGKGVTIDNANLKGEITVEIID
jgi:cellobiose phosphorylase